MYSFSIICCIFVGFPSFCSERRSKAEKLNCAYCHDWAIIGNNANDNGPKKIKTHKYTADIYIYCVTHSNNNQCLAGIIVKRAAVNESKLLNTRFFSLLFFVVFFRFIRFNATEMLLKQRKRQPSKTKTPNVAFCSVIRLCLIQLKIERILLRKWIIRYQHIFNSHWLCGKTLVIGDFFSTFSLFFWMKNQKGHIIICTLCPNHRVLQFDFLDGDGRLNAFFHCYCLYNRNKWRHSMVFGTTNRMYLERNKLRVSWFIRRWILKSSII